MSMLIEVWGDYACFSRPEMKTERVSYDIITPSAARGLVEAIYWHPGMKYHIDRIYLLNPVRFTNIRRNEVKSTCFPRRRSVRPRAVPRRCCTPRQTFSSGPRWCCRMCTTSSSATLP